MQALDPKYLERAQKIAEQLQSSEILAKYLEEEEEELYQALRDAFEPQLAELHAEVAMHDPLQLIALERELLKEEYEGVFLPRLLGYAVLRGEIQPDTVMYTRPQEHLKRVLEAIVNSANFDILKKRIGQSIQIGFALSSHIWVTNLINSFANPKVRKYLEMQKTDRYRDPRSRRLGLYRYAKQFANANYATADFPETLNELKVLGSSLKNFLRYRIRLEGADNSSLIEPLLAFAKNKNLRGNPGHLQISMLFALFFDYDDKVKKSLQKVFTELRKNIPDFQEVWFDFLRELYLEGPVPGKIEDQRAASLLDKSVDDELPPYYELMLKLHENGYSDVPFQKELQEFYDRHEGLSPISECLRYALLARFKEDIGQLEPRDYPQFFEISRHFTPFMEIFVNERFNHLLGETSMKFVKKCLKVFTDKRSKDYQDVKKFVTAQFEEWGFLNKKQIVELFKTPRKRKKTTA